MNFEVNNIKFKKPKNPKKTAKKFNMKNLLREKYDYQVQNDIGRLGKINMD